MPTRFALWLTIAAGVAVSFRSAAADDAGGDAARAASSSAPTVGAPTDRAAGEARTGDNRTAAEARTGDDRAAADLAQQAIAAHGGRDKLLSIFRLDEEFNSGPEARQPGTQRRSVLRNPDGWWLGSKERGVEPAKVAAWAWSLGILTDPRSRLELLPPVQDGEQALSGLRVAGSVDPPLDLYFDSGSHLLMRIDWRNDIYRFSDWTEQDGLMYSTRCVMHRRQTGAPWFHYRILKLERLTELPEGLKPVAAPAL